MSCKTDEVKRSLRKATKGVKQFGEEALYGAKQVGNWMKENPGDAAKLVGGLALGAFSITALILDGKDRIEQKQSLLKVWDPTIGAYIKLRREMSNTELWNYSQRVADGESRMKVLRSMGLLAK